MSDPELSLLPARGGRAVRLARGQALKHRQHARPAGRRHLGVQRRPTSPNSCRWSTAGSLGRIIPGIGDTLVTNRRRPILTLIADTSGGIHDTLFAACDRWRYEISAAPGITTTAPTTSPPLWPNSASRRRRRRRR